MPEDTGQEPNTSTTSPDPTSGPPSTDRADSGRDRRPPWERDGTPFDPERAWQLIERLRAQKRDDPSGTPTAPPLPNPPQPVPDGTTTTGDVQAQLDGLRSVLARERVARRYGLDDDLTDLLGDGDEATITARAKTLSDRLGQPAPATGSPVPRRPVEQLRGGADPTRPAEETDPAKLAAQVRRGF